MAPKAGVKIERRLTMAVAAALCLSTSRQPCGE